MQKYIHLEQAAPKLTGNPAIGLSMGMDAPPTESQTGILGYIAAHSPTAREGFRQAIRFSNLLSNAQIMELRETDDQAEFVYMRTDPMYFTIQGIELALSRAAAILKMLGGILNPILLTVSILTAISSGSSNTCFNLIGLVPLSIFPNFIALYLPNSV